MNRAFHALSFWIAVEHGWRVLAGALAITAVVYFILIAKLIKRTR